MNFINYQVKFKKLNKNAVLPRRGSNFSAGYDLYACMGQPVTIAPHTTEKIGIGLSFELPEGTFAGIYARSGLATKSGVRPANCVGVCDCDYRGEYVVACHNDTDEPRVIKPGDRIAQMIIQECKGIDFIDADLSDTDRGSGGFGSTGE